MNNANAKLDEIIAGIANAYRTLGGGQMRRLLTRFRLWQKKRQHHSDWEVIMQRLSDGGTVKAEKPNGVRFPWRW